MHPLNHGRAQWSSGWSYFLVTAGSLVGLANIFQFPFLAFKYGGLFVLLAVVCEFTIALPLLLSELLIGRRGKQNPVGSFELLSLESGQKTNWRWAGWLAFTVAFLTLSYYAVSAAQPVEYFLKSVALAYTNSTATIPAFQLDSSLSTQFRGLEIFFILLLAAVMVVIFRGINRGLEQISRIAVPLYVIIFAGLAIYTGIFGNFFAALHQLFYIPPDVPLIQILFAALTFSLFSLNVGMGALIVYGSYLPYTVPLGRSTFLLVCFDAGMSLISYFTMSSLFFQANPGTLGAEWTHINLMLIFNHVPHGFILAALFLFATILAIWMPMIAMAETVTVTLIERWNLSRRSAVFIVSILLLVLGTLVILSQTAEVNVKLFELHKIIETVSSKIFLPISAFLSAIFIGWILKKSVTQTELQLKPTLYHAWRFIVRYLAPLLILIVLI